MITVFWNFLFHRTFKILEASTWEYKDCDWIVLLELCCVSRIFCKNALVFMCFMLKRSLFSPQHKTILGERKAPFLSCSTTSENILCFYGKCCSEETIYTRLWPKKISSKLLIQRYVKHKKCFCITLLIRLISPCAWLHLFAVGQT